LTIKLSIWEKYRFCLSIPMMFPVPLSGLEYCDSRSQWMLWVSINIHVHTAKNGGIFCSALVRSSHRAHRKFIFLAFFLCVFYRIFCIGGKMCVLEMSWCLYFRSNWGIHSGIFQSFVCVYQMIFQPDDLSTRFVHISLISLILRIFTTPLMIFQPD